MGNPREVEKNAHANEAFELSNDDSSTCNNNVNKSEEADGSSSVKSGRQFDLLTDSERKKLKFSIFKNVIVISFAFMLLFTAFQSMANLQSSINKVLYE